MVFKIWTRCYSKVVGKLGKYVSRPRQEWPMRLPEQEKGRDFDLYTFTSIRQFAKPQHPLYRDRVL